MLVISLALVGLPGLLAVILRGTGWSTGALRPLLLALYGLECLLLWLPSTWVPSSGTIQRSPTPADLRALMQEKRLRASQRWGLELLSIGPAAAFALVALSYFVVR